MTDTRLNKQRFYRALSAIALTAGLASSPVYAAAAPTGGSAAASDTPAEIIVTAQKRAEPLQKVPLAVTVVSGDSLARLSSNSIEDAQEIVPALTFVKGDTSLNSALFLRGLGTVSFSIAAEPSVTSVLDGVVLARAGESFGDLYDLDRVEVLRGPQGTLFGKNASAGVINVISKEPGKTFSGYIDAGYFEGNEYKLKANLSGPIGNNWRAGVTGFYSQYAGNIYDQTLQTHINGYKHYGARGQIVGDIGPNLHVKLIADYRKADDQCCAFVIGALNPGAVPANAAVGTPLAAPSAANLAIESLLPPARGGATNQSIAWLANRTEEETYGSSMQLDYTLGGHTITSITAWRQWNNEEIRDGDWLNQPYLFGGTRFPQQHDDGPERSHTFTQELRLTSPTGGFVDYVAGLFYYQAVAARTYTRTDTYCVASTATPLANGLIPCSASNSTLVSPSGTGNFGSTFDNYAAYGQATWHFAPTVRLVTGLRYTHDKVSVFDLRTDNFTGSTFPNPLGGTISPAGIGANFDANVAAAGVTTGAGYTGTPWTGQTSANNLSGKAALEYDLAAHHMLYGSYSRGYKGPAYNVFYNMQYFNTAPISPELSDAFEVGLKNSFDGGKLILNIDGFYDKVRNYQANYPTTVNGTVTTTIINAGVVSTRGAEVEFLFRPVHSFTVNGGVSYTDAYVNQFNIPPAASAASYISPGTPLAFAPKVKATLGATYLAELENAPFNVEFNGNATFVSKQVSSLLPDGGNTLVAAAAQYAVNQNAIVAFQEQTIQAHDLVDLSIAAVDKTKRYRVAFIVKNLFNEHYASTIGSGGPGGSYEYQIPRDSNRYWGVTGRFNF